MTCPIFPLFLKSHPESTGVTVKCQPTAVLSPHYHFWRPSQSKSITPPLSTSFSGEEKLKMKAVFNSEPILSPIPPLKIKPGIPTPKAFLQFPLALTKRSRLIKAVLDSAAIDELSDIRNPAVSTSYRNPKFPKPNQTVLDAQTKVCTGPTQTRPLNAEQAFKVLDTILKSGKFQFILIFLYFFLNYELTF